MKREELPVKESNGLSSVNVGEEEVGFGGIKRQKCFYDGERVFLLIY